MKRVLVLGFALAFVLGLAGIAQAEEKQQPKGHRIHKIEKRIEQGEKSGQLTPQEATELNQKVDQLKTEKQEVAAQHEKVKEDLQKAKATTGEERKEALEKAKSDREKLVQERKELKTHTRELSHEVYKEKHDKAKIKVAGKKAEKLQQIEQARQGAEAKGQITPEESAKVKELEQKAQETK